MKKFFDVQDENQKLFDTVLKGTSIPTVIKFKLLAVEKTKFLYKVNKANEVLYHLTGYDFVVVVNEELFDQLDADQQKLVFDEAIAHITYDSDKDTVNLSKPDVTTFSGIISKYSIKEYLRVQESVKALLAQQEEKEKEAKSSKKKVKQFA